MSESTENTESRMESEMNIPDAATVYAEQSDPGMDRFLQNSRRDLMYELRRIQHGDRPVTGQGNREAINNFFFKRQEVRRSQETGSKGNIPSNVDDVEAHRPEAVTIEVQGLFEQRPVSSVLQSAAFRRHLERIIRGSIETITNRSSPTQPDPTPRTSRQQTSPNVAPSYVPSSVASGSRNAAPILPPPPPRSPSTAASVSSWVNHVSRRGSNDNDSHLSSQSSTAGLGALMGRVPDRLLNTAVHQVTLNSPQRPHVPLAPNLHVLGDAVLSNQRSDIGQQLAQSVDGIRPADDPVEVTLSAEQLSSMIHEQREALIEDVSELLHRRLVTSTLEGEFRGVLEVLLEDRPQVTGSDGPRVQQFIRSIPQTEHHVRNDFADMNVAHGAGGDNWDNISVTSISTRAVPFTHTNAHLSREMQALKSQMHEMQSMMRLSFDLQMDIQRAIRQEVSAALANVAGSLAITHAPASVTVHDSHCLICLDKHADSVLYQCGHMCVCYSCGRILMSSGSSCPICRAPIRDIIRAYKACTE